MPIKLFSTLIFLSILANNSLALKCYYCGVGNTDPEHPDEGGPCFAVDKVNTRVVTEINHTKSDAFIDQCKICFTGTDIKIGKGYVFRACVDHFPNSTIVDMKDGECYHPVKDEPNLRLCVCMSDLCNGLPPTFDEKPESVDTTPANEKSSKNFETGAKFGYHLLIGALFFLSWVQ